MDADSPNDYLDIHHYHRVLERGDHEDGMRASGEQLARGLVRFGNEVEIGYACEADRSPTRR